MRNYYYTMIKLNEYSHLGCYSRKVLSISLLHINLCGLVPHLGCYSNNVSAIFSNEEISLLYPDLFEQMYSSWLSETHFNNFKSMESLL